MIKLSEKILISVGDKYNHGKKFYMEKPVGTQGFLELGDNGRANRRLARKLKAFMYSDEFGELYTPPNFSDYSFSHAEQEYALKVNAQKVAQGLIFNDKYAAMVTVAVMKKALLRFFDKNTFLFNKFRDYICFSAFDSVGDKYDFIFCLQNRRDISRYDMQIKYNGWDFFLHSFTPDPDESAEKGLERFISNVEYDLKTFDTVIAPFIERERAVELQLFMNGGIPVHKGERAPIASTSDSTKKVSEINDLIRRWFDFDQCIVRYAIWDKNHDRIAYLNENNQILRDIRQCGYDEHSLERKFCITLREEVILCNKTPRLNDLWNKLNEELGTITVFEMQSPDEYVEKTIFVRNKNDCNFSFLWHYPLTVQPWEKSIENLIGELKCMRNKREYLDADIFLNYSSNSYSLLEMKDGAL